LFTAASARAQFTYSTISDPAGTSTWCQGVSNGTVFGHYLDSSGNGNGFIYSGGTFTKLDDPYAYGQFGTQPAGISGSTIVGTYQDIRTGTVRGFIDNGGSFTPLDDPSAAGTTIITGISGNNMVGYYEDSSDAWHGFEYNDSTSVFTTLDDPLRTSSNPKTDAMGIDGNTIVGWYIGASNSAGSETHGFSYNNSTYTSFDIPETTTSGTTTDPQSTTATGISGSLIVGNAYIEFITKTGTGFNVTADDFGFLYDGSNFTLLGVPDAGSQYPYETYAEAIDGSTVVGYYYVNYDTVEGFETTVPEPANMMLLLGGAGFLMRRRRNSARN
jgi:hypothetical protein